MVDTQTSGSFMRAYVSLGPPRHAAQLGDAGVSQPAGPGAASVTDGKRTPRVWQALLVPKYQHAAGRRCKTTHSRGRASLSSTT